MHQPVPATAAPGIGETHYDSISRAATLPGCLAGAAWLPALYVRPSTVSSLTENRMGNISASADTACRIPGAKRFSSSAVSVEVNRMFTGTARAIPVPNYRNVARL
jgi:hypothetical protein